MPHLVQSEVLSLEGVAKWLELLEDSMTIVVVSVSERFEREAEMRDRKVILIPLRERIVR